MTAAAAGPRVLHVMASGERGGGADHLTHVISKLTALGVRSSVAVSGGGPLAARLEQQGVAVHRVEMMRSRLDPRAVLALRRLVVAEAPDVVHCHGTRAAFFAALARLPAGYVYTVHGLSYRQDVSRARRAVLLAAEALACRRARFVVSVSAADLNDLTLRGYVPPGAGRHIPNAVALDRFKPGDRRQAKARLGLAESAVVVGTVARLVPQKAVHDLVDAVLQCEPVSLVIVGDGPLRRGLEARAAAAGARIQFLGARDDVAAVLQAFDVFALSSRWEGEPIALLEAMATGLPCVATATAGATEVLGEDGEAGRLVPIGAPRTMAATFAELAADPAARERLGKTARARVEPRSWESVAAQLARLYRDVCPTGR